MLTENIVGKLQLETLSGTLPETYEGVYAGDLLSRAMSHLTADQLWITIMPNVNVVAVASLCEAAAVILAEGVRPMDDALHAAEEKGICLTVSPFSVYEICAILAEEERSV